MLKDLIQFVPSHVCLKCDGCCRFKEADSSWRPKVADDEGLAEHIFAKEALDAGQRIKTMGCQNGTYQCRFFSPEGNVCTIYAYRPFECRLYPFILRQEGEAVILAAHGNCPHYQQTRREESFDQYVQYLRIFFGQFEVAEFLRKNRTLIDSYAAYKDELEDLFTIDL